ncbi:MAG: 3-methyl-2-oxobutanoate hydroxymethyltransferase [Solirubrobacteraceae bacterium]
MPQEVTASESSSRRPVTLPALAEKRRRGEPLVMITAYDFPSARIVDSAGVDMVLVGDSGAEMVLGYPSTVAVSVEEMLMLTAAVRRGLRTPLLIADLPFGSYEVSDEQAVQTAMRFVKQAGADVVKLERGTEVSLSRARAIIGAGVPVMGHIGLTPQTATALGGNRAQGRNVTDATRIATELIALQDAGCFAIVLEAMPAAVTEQLVTLATVPTIGIGAGPATDGQVLVFHDLLGIRDAGGARFVRRYAELQDDMIAGVSAYAADVRSHRYPAAEHCYSIDEAELERIRKSFAQLHTALPHATQ